MATSGSESRSCRVLELAAEFLGRYRAGERPALREYVERHPELAAEIREVFPAMAMMENIPLADDALEGDPTGAAPLAKSLPYEQLGDYRILGEVRRGGVGVNYEAEQASLGRWARRNPLVAGLGAAVFLLMAVIAVRSTIVAWRIEREKGAAQAAATRDAEPARRATRALEAEASSRRAAEAANASVRAAQERIGAGLYASKMNLVQVAWEEDNRQRMTELLGQTVPGPGEPDRRGFEWWYWNRQRRGDSQVLQIPALGERFAANQSLDGTRATFHVSEESTIWSGGNLRVGVCDTTSGRELFERRLWFAQNGGSANFRMALDRGGRRLAIAWPTSPQASDGTPPMIEVRAWDVAEGRELLAFSFDPGPTMPANDSPHIALGGNGKRLALVLDSMRAMGVPQVRVKVWDLDEAKEIWQTALNETATLRTSDLAISEDGGAIAIALDGYTGDRDHLLRQNLLRAWTVPEGRAVLALAESEATYAELRFRPDGARLAALRFTVDPTVEDGSAPSMRDPTIQLFDTATGQLVKTFRASHDAANTFAHLAYSGDGARIAILDQLEPPRVRIVDGDTGADQSEIREDAAAGVFLSPVFTLDGSRLTMIVGSSVKRSDLSGSTRGRAGIASSPKLPRARALSLSGDGSRVALVAPQADARTPEVTALDTASGRELGRQALSPLPRSDEVGRIPIYRVVFSRDNARLAAWPRPARAQPGFPRTEPTIALWDTRTNVCREFRAIDADSGFVDEVCFHPDATTIAALVSAPRPEPATDEKLKTRVQIRDGADGRLLSQWEVPGVALTTLAYSPDGGTLLAVGATGSGETPAQQVLLLDPGDGRVLRTIAVPGPAPVTQLLQHPDGGILVGLSGGTAGSEGFIAAWDIASGRELWRTGGFVSYSSASGGVLPAVLSPGGRRLVAARQASGAQGTEVWFWDTATGQEVMNLACDGPNPQALAFDRGGRRLFIGHCFTDDFPTSDTKLIVLDASPLPPDVLAGDRINELVFEYPLHDELRTRLAADPSLAPEVRAVVPRVLARRVESVSRLRVRAHELALPPKRPVTDYERALRYAVAGLGQRGDDPGLLTAQGMALVRLNRDPVRALAALTAASRGDADPEAIAFLALLLHRLGRQVEAAGSLARFRTRVQELGARGGAGLADLQREVEGQLSPLPIRREDDRPQSGH
jgi:WD40 repeat protein